MRVIASFCWRVYEEPSGKQHTADDDETRSSSGSLTNYYDSRPRHLRHHGTFSSSLRLCPFKFSPVLTLLLPPLISAEAITANLFENMLFPRTTDGKLCHQDGPSTCNVNSVLRLKRHLSLLENVPTYLLDDWAQTGTVFDNMRDFLRRLRWC